MQAESVLGAVGISQMVVRPGDTALAHGSGDMPILSSSLLVTLIESACNSAITEFLDNGETTTLANVELEIHDALGIGSEIQGSATCVSHEDGVLGFACEIHDGSRLIATSVMRRALVERVTFLARTAAFSLITEGSQK
ncbi:MAG: thioesterase [Actinobacteria bacterium]|nr:thioesterase [Actinomycetota bacterium]